MGEINFRSSFHSLPQKRLKVKHGEAREVFLGDCSGGKGEVGFIVDGIVRNNFFCRDIVDASARSKELREELSKVRRLLSVDGYRGFSDTIEILRNLQLGRIKKDDDCEAFLMFLIRRFNEIKVSEKVAPFIVELKKTFEEVLMEVVSKGI